MSPISSEIASELSEIVCATCGSRRLRRLPRIGFLQQKVYPLMGYYPWECPICRQVKLFRKRGERIRRRSRVGE